MMQHVYHPYHVKSGGGSECLIESIAVNQDDLFRLTQHIGMRSTHKCMSFFGERASVFSAISSVINEPFSIPEKKGKTKRRYQLSTLLKDDLLIFFVALSDDFLHQKNFDKETILVTLFRYLQDLSEIIFLCPDDEIVSEFFPGPKNPFQTNAHSKTMFKLEEHSGEIEYSDIETNTSILASELGSNLEDLILNENASRFFLHCRYSTFDSSVLDLKRQNFLHAQKQLQGKAVSHNFTDIQSVLSESDIELNEELLRKLGSCHKNYVDNIIRTRNNLIQLLNITISHVRDNFANNSPWWSWWKGKKKYSAFEAIEYRQIQAAAKFISNLLMDLAISEISKICSIDEVLYQAYELSVSQIAEFFCLNIGRVDDSKFEKLKSEIKHTMSQHQFRNMIKCESIKHYITSFINETSAIIDIYLANLKQVTTLQLSPCTVNVIQDNNGKYLNLTFAQFTVIPTITMTPPDLEKLFGIKRAASSHCNYKELIESIRVVSSYPMHNGRAFLVLLAFEPKSYSSYSSEKTTQVLVVLSSSSFRRIQNFYLKDYLVILGSDAHDVQSLTLTIILPKEKNILIGEINESWMWRQIKNFDFSRTSIYGKLVSAAKIPNGDKLLLLSDSGSIYELNMQHDLFEEVLIRENTEHGISSKRFYDVKNKKYKKVQSLSVEKYFVLSSDNYVDVYDLNMNCVRSFESRGNIGVKIFSDNINVYLSTIRKNDVRSHMFLGLGTDVLLKSKESSKKEVLNGNPIIDIIYASFLKYGPNSYFIGASEASDYRLIIQRKNDEFERALQSYMKTFATRFAIKLVYVDLARDMCLQATENPHVLSILQSRTPLHICTIEENNLIPLLDGTRKRIIGELASISNTAACINFAHLEKVLSELSHVNGMRVVSIIGRQSSGKSYLLNRLFGTRFSVSATRCTDGIWISYARLVCKESSVEKDFLLLDCEGLFSITRNEQEEVKLLTVLAAVSDVTILNQDLNFNRYINRLFCNLNNAVDRVKGSSYFEGFLMVAVRDVSSEEGSKAAEEFERNMAVMNQRGEHKFLRRLFKGTMMLHCLNNYSNRDVFADEIDGIRSTFFDFDFNSYGISEKHWLDGNSCMQNLKVVLLQVHNDDEQSADEHLKQMKLANIEHDILSSFTQISKIGEFAKREVPVPNKDIGENNLFSDVDDHDGKISQLDIAGDTVADDETDNYSLIYTRLEKIFFKRSEDKQEKEWFNRRWLAFNSLLENFVKQRLACLQEYVEGEVAKLRELLSNDEKKTFLIGVKETIQKIGANYSLCLQTCSECNLVCIRRKGHNESKANEKVILEKRLQEYTDAATYKIQYEAIVEKQKTLDEYNKKILHLKQQRDVIAQYEEVVQNFKNCKKELENTKSVFEAKRAELKKIDTGSVGYGEFHKVLRQHLDRGIGNWNLLCQELRRCTIPQDVSDDVIEKGLTDKLYETVTEIAHQFTPKCDLKLSLPTKVFEQPLKAFEIFIDLPENWSNESDRNPIHEDEGTKERLNSALNRLIESLTDDIKSLKIAQSAFSDIQRLCETCKNYLKRSSDSISSTKCMVSTNETELKNLKSSVEELHKQKEVATRDKIDLEQKVQQHKQTADNIARHMEELQSKEGGIISSFAGNIEVDSIISLLKNEIEEIKKMREEYRKKYPLQIEQESDVLAVEEAIIEYFIHELTKECKMEGMEWEVVDESLLKGEQHSTAVMQERSQNESYSESDFGRSDGVDPPGILDATPIEKKSDKLDSSSSSGYVVPDILVNDYAQQFHNDYIRTLAKEIAKTQQDISICITCLNEYTDLGTKICNLEESIALSSGAQYKTQIDNLQSKTECLKREQDDISKNLDIKCQAVKNKEEKLKRFNENGYNSDGEEFTDDQRLKLEQNIRKLVEDKENLQSKLQALSQQHEQVQSEISELNETIKKTENASNSMHIECELQRLKTAVMEQKNTYESNMALLKETEQKRSNLRKVFRDQLWNDEIKKRMHDLYLQRTEKERKVMELEQSQNELKNLRQEMIKITEENGSSQKELDLLNQNLYEITQTVKLHKKQLDNLMDEIKNTEHKTQKTNEELATMETEYASLNKFSSVLELCLRISEKCHGITIGFSEDFTQSQRNTEAFTQFWQLRNAIEALECDIQADEVNVQDLSKKVQEQEKERKKFGSSEAVLKELCFSEAQYATIEVELNHLQKGRKAQEEYNAIKKKLEMVEMELQCKCPTDHKCDRCCQICDDSPACKFKAGHEGDHLCMKDQHDCQHKCEVCNENNCMYALGHKNPAKHKCSSTHQCKKICQYCSNTCVKSIVDSHENHCCNETICTKKCIFCGNQCGEAHDHEDSAELVNDPKVKEDEADGERIKLHLCGKEHKCPHTCEEEGVCEVQYISETRMYENELCPQEYEYIKPQMTRKQCGILIQPNDLFHKETHNCYCEHKCEVSCPECGSYCNKTVGHTGKHTTVTHRNKEYCYCVSKTEGSLITISETDGGKKARIYQPGDKFVLETCSQQCSRKGRAHYHLLQCPEGMECAEKKYPGAAQHSTDHFYPFCDIVYDKLLCSSFWTHYNWQMPCDANSVCLCNSYCPHSSHAADTPSFCTSAAWHTESTLAKNHEFTCHDFKKLIINGVDICFCIDTTGSMGPYIDQSKATIKRIMSETAPKLAERGSDTSSLRFAVVSYKDHCDPVVVKSSSFVGHQQALEFLQTLTADGGGDAPEAVLDGLDAAADLAWKIENTKIMFHICDSPPHGRKFLNSQGDSYPDGCPCGRSEEKVLKKLRDKGVTYYVIALTNHVNQMIEIFQKIMPVTRKTLTSSVEMDSIITLCVCKVIEDSELTATVTEEFDIDEQK